MWTDSEDLEPQALLGATFGIRAQRKYRQTPRYGECGKGQGRGSSTDKECWNLALVFGKGWGKEKCEKGNAKRAFETEKKAELMHMVDCAWMASSETTVSGRLGLEWRVEEQEARTDRR